MKKKKDLGILTLIYILAYVIGYLSCMSITNTVLKFFIFDTVATIVTFIFSVIYKNSSVYDPYWSLTPMVMAIWLFIECRAASLFQLLFMAAFIAWSMRLTLNWVHVFTDFSYEDWRYIKYRNETPKALWPIVNFFGIHYVPTIIVFLGMLPIFVIAENGIGANSIYGILIMLMGVSFEYFADTEMHEFLESTEEKTVCKNGLWRYSRHPNYLGEITMWFGVYVTMLPYASEHWYLGIGFVSVAFLFNVVSIPLMEKRQLSRRPEYAEYQNETNRLLLMPVKKGK